MKRPALPGELELREGFVDDYEALRNTAGAVRLGRDVLLVHGPQAFEYLQGQCTQDLLALPVGRTTDALLLEPQGKLDALIRVTKAADDGFVVDVANGYGEAVRARLERFKLRIKAEIETLPWRCVALRGKKTSELSVPPSGPVTDGVRNGPLVIQYSWNGVEGFDVIGEAPEVPHGVRHCGDDALEALRIEAGIPEMGFELDDRTIPAEAHLLERCVSFTKGCYTGQELVARLDARGNRVARQLRGLVLVGETLITDVGGAEIVRGESRQKGEVGETGEVGEVGETAEKALGRVTSAAWSPALGAVAALGYVHRSLTPPATVELRISPSAGESQAEPRVQVQAELRELPLV